MSLGRQNHISFSFTSYTRFEIDVQFTEKCKSICMVEKGFEKHIIENKKKSYKKKPVFFAPDLICLAQICI